MMRKTSLGRRAALLVALSAGVIGGAEGFATAAAQTAQQTYRFAIAAKPVRQGLNDIGRITGLTVVFSETEAASATGKAVTGSLTARDALARLLAGSGLVFVLASSPGVAARLGLPSMYFVGRHAVYLVPAALLLLGCSLLSPKGVRRFSIGVRRSRVNFRAGLVRCFVADVATHVGSRMNGAR